MHTTFTANGFRPRTGYRHIGKLANHHDATPGQMHACNRTAAGVVSLCGLAIDTAAENDYGDPVTTVFSADARRVTCNRCRKLIGMPVTKRTKQTAMRFGS